MKNNEEDDENEWTEDGNGMAFNFHSIYFPLFIRNDKISWEFYCIIFVHGDGNCILLGGVFSVYGYNKIDVIGWDVFLIQIFAGFCLFDHSNRNIKLLEK